MGTANLVEVFSSVQGEGIHVGSTTLFVRFGGCDLRCRWCDSPHTWQPAAACRFEVSRGSGRFREVPNPVPLAAVLEAAEGLELSAHRFVSLTGGEPLLQPEAVLELAGSLRTRGPRIHLETHGVATDALARVVEAVDVVSMDWKLASDVRREGQPFHAPGEPFHAEHERFLRTARAAPEVVVKVVVTPASEDAEIDEMAERIAAVDAGIPLVVQPVTPFGGVREPPGAERLLGLVAHLSHRLTDVRLVPQTHKSVGVL
ncbi:MAG: 7-carboxy-7-deazaguanine synthase QueE [Myxococcota bacterium]|nr:7-carboxy-7-deazaguanine synthase QueE [Myxococcota bacterium]